MLPCDSSHKRTKLCLEKKNYHEQIGLNFYKKSLANMTVVAVLLLIDREFVGKKKHNNQTNTETPFKNVFLKNLKDQV